MRYCFSKRREKGKETFPTEVGVIQMLAFDANRVIIVEG